MVTRRLSSALALCGLLFALAAQAEAADLAGKWKLTVMAPNDAPMLVLNLTGEEGKLGGEVAASAQNLLPGAKIGDVQVAEDTLSIAVAHGAATETFSGKIPADGATDKVLGSFTFRGTTYPARLERTDSDEVGQMTASPVLQQAMQLRREPDAKKRVEGLKQIIADHGGDSFVMPAYEYLLQAAHGAELSADEVAEHIKAWTDAAGAYGDKYAAQVKTRAIAALRGAKPYAEMRLKMAQEAEAALPADASTEDRSAIAGAVYESADAAGKSDIASEAKMRWDGFEAQLDKEYHAKVPPFEPKAFAGRAAGAERIVLLELFTGAQCPPCVAADVAFDGLLESYQPTELVALQYHLHIPGPDPLTNAASEERAKFYGVRGTPSTYFNGESQAGGGGGMANSEMKYNQYVGLIDQDMAGEAPATVDLKVTRSGDELLISATAQVDASALAVAADDKDEDGDDDKDDAKDEDEEGDDDENDDKEAAAEPKLRLRLVLAEDVIRYVGGNKLRFHHHVVRDMPGGAEGIEIVGGQAQTDVTVNLTELREKIETYLADYAAKREFPAALPEVALENLTVVALVQNDADKSVLGVMSVEAPPAN